MDVKRLAAAGLCALAALPLADALNAGYERGLRGASAAVACGLLRCGGMAIARAGTTLVTPAGRYEVLLPCSGGRFLAAALSLACAAAVLSRAAWPRRLACVLVAAPLALCANATRVAALVATDATGSPAIHTALGVACFVPVALALAAVAGLFSRAGP